MKNGIVLGAVMIHIVYCVESVRIEVRHKVVLQRLWMDGQENNQVTKNSFSR